MMLRNRAIRWLGGYTPETVHTLLDNYAEMRVVVRDYNDVMRELDQYCECGEADCRTTRLRAALARIGDDHVPASDG